MSRPGQAVAWKEGTGIQASTGSRLGRDRQVFTPGEAAVKGGRDSLLSQNRQWLGEEEQALRPGQAVA